MHVLIGFLLFIATHSRLVFREVHTGCVKRFSHWRRVVILLTSASKFNIEPNGGIFDVTQENDHASPNVKSPSCTASPRNSIGNREICDAVLLNVASTQRRVVCGDWLASAMETVMTSWICVLFWTLVLARRVFEGRAQSLSMPVFVGAASQNKSMNTVFLQVYMSMGKVLLVNGHVHGSKSKGTAHPCTCQWVLYPCTSQ